MFRIKTESSIGKIILGLKVDFNPQKARFLEAGSRESGVVDKNKYTVGFHAPKMCQLSGFGVASGRVKSIRFPS